MAALARAARARSMNFSRRSPLICDDAELRANRLRLLARIRDTLNRGRRFLADRRDRRAMAKWVYSFGDGSAEGRADMKNLLGGKGANLAEMSNLGLPVPPGFTITTEVCTYFYANNKTYPDDLRTQVDDGARGSSSSASARKFGDAGESAARLGALRRARLDAGHDGHGAQSRPQRPHGRGPRDRAAATRASPMTAIAASSRCTARSCSASTTISSRTCSRTTSSIIGVDARHRA